jgi:hypothetical protein
MSWTVPGGGAGSGLWPAGRSATMTRPVTPDDDREVLPARVAGDGPLAGSEPVAVLGCDPGTCTGMAFLPPHGPLTAFQCSGHAAAWLARQLLEASEGARVIAAGEAFVPGPGTGRDATVTRQVITSLDGVARWHWRPAGEVKAWATDERLRIAGMLALTAKMPRDARDACRHLLFCAVHDCGMPDPLARGAVAWWKDRARS